MARTLSTERRYASLLLSQSIVKYRCYQFNPINLSQTYIATIALILAQVLPKFGITIGSEELTTTLSTLITIIGGIWIMVRRYQAGGINIFGARK